MRRRGSIILVLALVCAVSVTALNVPSAAAVPPGTGPATVRCSSNSGTLTASPALRFVTIPPAVKPGPTLTLASTWAACKGKRRSSKDSFTSGGRIDAVFQSPRARHYCPDRYGNGLVGETLQGTAVLSWSDGTQTTAKLSLKLTTVAGHTTSGIPAGSVAGPIGGLYEFTSPISGAITVAKGLRWNGFGGDCTSGQTIGVMPVTQLSLTIGFATPWLVSVGDSSISGEGGRWAGNSNTTLNTDSGSDAYANDTAAGLAEKCHRSKSAEVFIGVGVSSKNFGCSGARAASGNNSDSPAIWKPGIDFAPAPVSREPGQAQMLQNFAKLHSIHAVLVRIGVNNFDFGDIVAQCVADWLKPESTDVCNDDLSVLANFRDGTNGEPDQLAVNTAEITQAFKNIRVAMINAGYNASLYKVIVQTYPSPVPDSINRYAEINSLERQNKGGCGIWNADAAWMNGGGLVLVNNAVKNARIASGLTNVVTLDSADSFVGHRLCEDGVGLLEDTSFASGTTAGAADQLEWVTQIRITQELIDTHPALALLLAIAGVSGGPYQTQEGFHPNYWGQLAQRGCVRQAYAAAAISVGWTRRCTPTAGGGTNSLGEPKMTLNPQ